MRILVIRFIHVGSAKVGAFQMKPLHFRLAQICITEVVAGERSTLNLHAPQILASEYWLDMWILAPPAVPGRSPFRKFPDVFLRQLVTTFEGIGLLEVLTHNLADGTCFDDVA